MLDLQKVDDTLDDVKSRWDHGEALYNPDMLALIRAAEALRAAVTEIQATLTAALGGREAIPEQADVVDLAHAVKSQIGGHHNTLKSMASLRNKWAAELDEALADRSFFEIRKVRDKIKGSEA